MSHQVYKFEPGQCTCILGDPGAGSHRVNVRKLSGLEAVLDPTFLLEKNQYVYTTVKLEDGPSLALSGLVVTSAAGGILIQWMHSNPRDADKIDAAVSEYLRARQKSATAVASPSATGAFAAQAAPPTTVPASPALPVMPAAAAPPAPPPAPPLSPDPKKILPATPFPKEPKTEKITRPAGVSPPPRSRRTRAALKAISAPKVALEPKANVEPKTVAEPKASTEPKEAAELKSSPDGSLDVGARLRSRAKTVLSSELASRLETVQVVNMGAIRNLVKEAVDESMALHGASLQEADRKRLLEEAEAAFAERLELFKSEKSGLEEQIKTLEESFTKAQQLLDEERAKVLSANQFTVSDAGMIELEQRLGRLLDRAIKTGQVSSQFEEEMRGVVVRLLDDERDKIREQAQQAQSDKIALLEKKVERLASSLESAESERDFARERAQALEAAGGSLRNIMLAGLDAKDPRRARKLGLLKEIYKINRDIRKQLVAAGRLPQASAESPPHVHEEAKIASELGIKRSAQASGSPEAEKADADVPDATEVPVLATWTEVDPDDLPWESPGEEAAKESKPAKIKQFGRGR